MIEECNWLQALEGGIDTSHAPILHRLITTNSSRPGISPKNPFVRGKAPALVVDLTDWGYHYAGIRPLDESDMHIRTYHFVLPFHQIRPYQTNAGGKAVAGHIWVPMDDGTTMVYNWHHSTTDAPLDDEDRMERRSGNGPAHVDQTTFRSQANRGNNYLLDRRVQKTETFTGIDGINTQDRGIQESMGPVVDRSKEHLGPADKAIIQARRLLLGAIKTVQQGGTPRGVEATRPAASTRATTRCARPRACCRATPTGARRSCPSWRARRSSRPFEDGGPRRASPSLAVPRRITDAPVPLAGAFGLPPLSMRGGSSSSSPRGTRLRDFRQLDWMRTPIGLVRRISFTESRRLPKEEFDDRFRRAMCVRDPSAVRLQGRGVY